MRPGHGSASRRTACSCSARQAREPLAQRRVVVRQDAQSRAGAAFAAPLVADGQRAHRHAARHLHDRQQRVHALERAALDRARRAPGTTVCAATIPGRCAAPPAAAMITWMPRRSAADAYSAIRTGVRCADTTRHSCGTPKRLQHLVRMAHRFPVGLAAHDHRDQRAVVCHPGILLSGGRGRVGARGWFLVPGSGFQVGFRVPGSFGFRVPIPGSGFRSCLRGFSGRSGNREADDRHDGDTDHVVPEK